MYEHTQKFTQRKQEASSYDAARVICQECGVPIISREPGNNAASSSHSAGLQAAATAFRELLETLLVVQPPDLLSRVAAAVLPYVTLDGTQVVEDVSIPDDAAEGTYTVHKGVSILCDVWGPKTRLSVISSMKSCCSVSTLLRCSFLTLRVVCMLMPTFPDVQQPAQSSATLHLIL